MLKLIAHGTTGSDSIEKGIHLRWGFNDDLGFPPCFKLYRRESDPGKRFCFPLSQVAGQITSAPFTYSAPGSTFRFTIRNLINKPLAKVACNGFQVNGEIEIAFSQTISRIEIEYCLEPKSDFTILVSQVADAFVPLPIDGSSLTAPQTEFSAFDCAQASSVVLKGNGIFLTQICVWVCDEKGNNAWEQINGDCGCGLPVYQKGTPFISKNFPEIKNLDWATALCRMQGTKYPATLTPASFDAMKPVLETVFGEGIKIPVGWTLYKPDSPSADQSDLSVSMYDSLLMQSFDVTIARLLGLYWLDRNALIDKYYDYKVTATWPDRLKRCLDHDVNFETYEDNQSLYASFIHDGIAFMTLSNPLISYRPSADLRADRALVYSGPDAFIVVPAGTTEVQIFVAKKALGSLKFEAFHVGETTAVDTETLLLHEGIVSLKAKEINTIRITGGDALIYRVRYTQKPFPHGEQQYVVCGVKIANQHPLTRPRNTEAVQLKGGTVNNSDGTHKRNNYLVGLRWNANEKSSSPLLSLAPVAYRIRRAEGAALPVIITPNSPVFVSPSTEDSYAAPEGWPGKRQFYLDKKVAHNRYTYDVQAIDLFGRKSDFSKPVSVNVLDPSPAPPSDVAAKFLDYSSYDAATDTFSDMSLNVLEKEWLKSAGVNGIHVSWRWTAEQERTSINVKEFHVHFQDGWLNVYKGTLTLEPVSSTITVASLGLTASELAEFPVLRSLTSVNIYTFTASLGTSTVAANGFRLCWMKQGGNAFLVLKNTNGSTPKISVMKPPAPLTGIPENGKGMAISITPGKPAFIDYRKISAWTNTRVKAKTSYTGVKVYHEFISSPAFPYPAISASDIDKTRYAQIGVSTHNLDAASAVSSPAAIVAVYRSAPTALVLDSSLYGDLDELSATAPDVHGKSAFYLRWVKQGNGKTYEVYRALDHTLHSVAKKNDSSLGNYNDLSNSKWQEIASKPENEQAFTRINANPITESDSIYQDRVTEIAAAGSASTYTPSSSLLLYADESLDGTGTNRYFYRLRVIDTNGLGSALSDSTPPVAVPVAKPVQAPVITAVVGDRNAIKVQWGIQPGQVVAGYLVYRTEDAALAGDWRRMDLLRAEGATYSVDVNATFAAYDYTDETVIARTPYYYGVVAVNIAGDGSKLRSLMSVVKQGQAYDLTPPEAPEWDEENSGWVFVDASGNVYETEEDAGSVEVSEAVRLVWEVPSGKNCTSEIRRYSLDEPSGQIVVDADTTITTRSDTQLQWVDTNVSSGLGYRYGLRALSASGIYSSTANNLFTASSD